MIERFNGPYLKHNGDWDETLPIGQVVAEEQDGRLHCVIYSCPCGCGDLQAINTQGSHLPKSWDGSFDDQNRLTLSPSVNRTSACLSHYFITNGVVQWC